MLLITTSLSADEPPKAKTGKQYALLAGCTKYDNGDIPELWGPANDTAAWHKLLTEQFGFPEANITKLVASGRDGKPETDAAKRPTRANIAKGFEGLIAKASPGDRIFILLSGHGCQIPIPAGQDPLDPKNFEPDGLDEAFLPVDVVLKDGSLKNHILDDEIGAWLDKIRDKGADVLVVFDCCHSGTMTRGGPLDVERTRLVLPQTLGIPDKEVKAAVQRAADARAKAEKAGRNLEAEAAKIHGKKDPKGRGSLAAFYAAQPFQTAPELPRPEGVEQVRENYYGMLSWTLIQTLRDSRGKLTYRELEQVMIARYRAARGTRDPIPFAEGDTDREVFGLERMPNSGVFTLRVQMGKPLQVSAGQLAGLTPGTVLAVYPSPDNPKKRDPKAVIGYVKVGDKPTAYEAKVIPVAFERPSATDPKKTEAVPAPKPEDLDDLGRCEVAARDYGEMRVKMFFPNNPAVKAAFDKVEKEVRDMVLPIFVEPKADAKTQAEAVALAEAKAEWVLKVVDPKTAATEYGLTKLNADHVLLLRAPGHEIDPKEAAAVADQITKTGKAPPRRVFGAYPLANPKQLTAVLERDIQKIFKWQNVWRVSAGISGEKGGDALGVTLEVRRLKDEKDDKGEILRSGTVPNKGYLGFVVKNGGKHDVWVVAVWLDAEFGIEQYEVVQIQAYKEARLSNAQIDDGPGVTGTEGMVLFVFSQDVQKERPDFKFLNQTQLRVDEKLKRGDRMRDVPKSAFGNLVAKSTLFSGDRGPVKTDPQTPAVIVKPWVVTPEQK